MATGFFIGRFQPFHRGHEHAIRQIAKEVDRIIIGIGSAQESHTFDNPFTAKEREEMISGSLGNDVSYGIVRISDINSYPLWVNHVRSLSPEFDVVYTGNKIVSDLFNESGVEVRSVNHHTYTSATQIRNMMNKDEESWKHLVPQGTLDVMAGCGGVDRIKDIFSTRLSKPSLTVDALVRRNDEILLIKRNNEPFKENFAKFANSINSK